MRLKRDRKVDVMNNKVPAAWRVTGNQHAYKARLLKQKGSSPFCSFLLEAKKVNPPGKKDGFQRKSQRHVSGVSFEKVDALSRESEPNESVGSCSVLSDDVSSDGESFRVEQHEVAASIHKIELHAYRSTLEALYASGPLSWEKEALLTNLRINLNISNDEHLTELRHLISPGARILD